MRNDQSLCPHAALKRTAMPMELEPGRRFFRATQCQIHRFFGALIAVAMLLSAHPSFAQRKPGATRSLPSPAQHATVRDGSFRSESLGRDMRYRVILPAGYENSSERYPTLFLLHGLYGDFENWSTRTNLISYAEHLRLIIVMPDANDSWYVNSAIVPADRFEDYIVKDFVGEIDSHFRTIREQYARAIAGLSMGGYGAAKFALKYPQLFAIAGGISAALNAPGDLDDRVPDFSANLQRVFGPHGSPIRGQNDVFALLAHADPSKLPYIYLDCGTSDFLFLFSNREFAARLQERKVPYEFHEMQGAHTWDFWDAAILRFLNTLSERSFAAKASPR
jgi:S-formylglutathione hydrolase FrmB